MATAKEWLDEINGVGLQWFSTFTRKPAASASGQTVGNQTTAPPVTNQVATQLGPYTGVIVVGVVVLAVVIVLAIVLRK